MIELSRPEVLFNPLTSQFYDLFAWPFVTLTTSKMLEYLDPQDTVLEIGSGTGLATTILATKVKRVVGVEPSPHMLARAREKLSLYGLQDRVTLLSGRVERIPDVGQVDAVVLSYVLRHINPKNLDKAIDEVRRVTRLGAKLLIADLHLPFSGTFTEVKLGNPNYLVLGVLAIYNPESLVKYLEGKGFRELALSYYPLCFLVVMDKFV